MNRQMSRKARLLLACLLGSAMATLTLSAHAARDGESGAGKGSPYHAVSVPERARDYYRSVWGVDNFLVRRTASENLVRFSYRVTDPTRAKILSDRRVTPYLVAQRSRAVLQVPTMEKVGLLRQSGAQEAGKEYWMVFSNKGNLVKAGDRVNVIIGSFHVDGMLVE